MRLTFFVLIFVLDLLKPITPVQAQTDIPVGSWRLHISFNDLNSIALANDRVIAATDAGLMIYDKNDFEINTVTKIDGLSGSIITSIGYDPNRDQIIVAFEDGLINIIDDNKISVISTLATTSAISGSRRINHININNNLAYLSTDFGVVVFDLDQKELKETYRDLSDMGEALKIFESVTFQDSLFLATEKGVLSGALSGFSNLLDFRNWNRYDEGTLDNSIASITVFNNAIFAAINLQGIYKLQSGSWSQLGFLQTSEFRKLGSSLSNLVITTTGQVWTSDEVSVIEIGTGEVSNPDEAFQDQEGKIWIADGVNGLLSESGGNVTSTVPNGPSSNKLWRLNYSSDRIVSNKGGFTSSFQPLNRTVNADQFVNGQWVTLPTNINTDITDNAQASNVNYVSSFTFGLERTGPEGTVVFDDTNSPLSKINPTDPFVPVTSIEVSSDGLWVANYGSITPLLLLRSDLSWQSFSFSQPQGRFIRELLVDQQDFVWMIVEPSNGGGILVFNKSNDESIYLTTVAGKGGLPSSNVRSLASDRDGQIWAGTDEGVVYFSNPGSVFSTSVDAVRPIFENRFLLRDESVTAIAIDGGNRKWLGTNNGVWLFDPTGEELIYNFTEDNSPLLSNKIVSIAIDPISGEVFFATDKGLASFRSTATSSSIQFNAVKIFPNPVDAGFTGQVAINGLYTDAIVKITDIGGRLIWQAQANGGTAVWNARQSNGDRVSSGVYLVFATSEDGTERHVGKIAIVE